MAPAENETKCIIIKKALPYPIVSRSLLRGWGGGVRITGHLCPWRGLLHRTSITFWRCKDNDDIFLLQILYTKN